MSEIEQGTSTEIELVEPLRGLPGLWWYGQQDRGGQNFQAVFRFPNYYGASVVKGPTTYGIEVATMLWQPESPVAADVPENRRYDTFQEYADFADPLSSHGEDGIFGWNDRAGLADLLTRLSALPSPYTSELEQTKELES